MSGGYVIVIGLCYGCAKPFSFNPVRVPSIRIDGERLPICEHCIARANTRRAAMGLPPHVPHPGAYEAIPEEEMLLTPAGDDQ